MKKQIFTFLLSLLAIVGGFAQTTYYVDANSGSSSNDGLSWTSSKQTLKQALDASASGDIIKVTQGIYKEGATLTLTKSVTIRGGYISGTDTQNYNQPTNLSGNNAYRIMIIETVGVTVNIDNILFSNARADTGGAIKSYMPGSSNTGSLNFSFCTFTNCTSTSGLGGAIMTKWPDVSLSHCTFYGNTTKTVGGVYIKYGTAKVDDCAFYNNTCEANGAGLYYVGASIKITNSTFANNSATTATSKGGGLTLESESSLTSAFEINNSIFWGNTSANVSPQIHLSLM